MPEFLKRLRTCVEKRQKDNSKRVLTRLSTKKKDKYYLTSELIDLDGSRKIKKILLEKDQIKEARKDTYSLKEANFMLANQGIKSITECKRILSEEGFSGDLNTLLLHNFQEHLEELQARPYTPEKGTELKTLTIRLQIQKIIDEISHPTIQDPAERKLFILSCGEELKPSNQIHPELEQITQNVRAMPFLKRVKIRFMEENKEFKKRCWHIDLLHQLFVHEHPQATTDERDQSYKHLANELHNRYLQNKLGSKKLGFDKLEKVYPELKRITPEDKKQLAHELAATIVIGRQLITTQKFLDTAESIEPDFSNMLKDFVELKVLPKRFANLELVSENDLRHAVEIAPLCDLWPMLIKPKVNNTKELIEYLKFLTGLYHQGMKGKEELKKLGINIENLGLTGVGMEDIGGYVKDTLDAIKSLRLSRPAPRWRPLPFVKDIAEGKSFIDRFKQAISNKQVKNLEEASAKVMFDMIEKSRKSKKLYFNEKEIKWDAASHKPEIATAVYAAAKHISNRGPDSVKDAKRILKDAGFSGDLNSALIAGVKLLLQKESYGHTKPEFENLVKPYVSTIDYAIEKVVEKINGTDQNDTKSLNSHMASLSTAGVLREEIGDPKVEALRQNLRNMPYLPFLMATKRQRGYEAVKREYLSDYFSQFVNFESRDKTKDLGQGKEEIIQKMVKKNSTKPDKYPALNRLLEVYPELGVVMHKDKIDIVKDLVCMSYFLEERNELDEATLAMVNMLQAGTPILQDLVIHGLIPLDYADPSKLSSIQLSALADMVKNSDVWERFKTQAEQDGQKINSTAQIEAVFRSLARRSFDHERLANFATTLHAMHISKLPEWEPYKVSVVKNLMQASTALTEAKENEVKKKRKKKKGRKNKKIEKVITIADLELDLEKIKKKHEEKIIEEDKEIGWAERDLDKMRKDLDSIKSATALLSNDTVKKISDGISAICNSLYSDEAKKTRFPLRVNSFMLRGMTVPSPGLMGHVEGIIDYWHKIKKVKAREDMPDLALLTEREWTHFKTKILQHPNMNVYEMMKKYSQNNKDKLGTEKLNFKSEFDQDRIQLLCGYMEKTVKAVIGETTGSELQKMKQEFRSQFDIIRKEEQEHRRTLKTNVKISGAEAIQDFMRHLNKEYFWGVSFLPGKILDIANIKHRTTIKKMLMALEKECDLEIDLETQKAKVEKLKDYKREKEINHNNKVQHIESMIMEMKT